MKTKLRFTQSPPSPQRDSGWISRACEPRPIEEKENLCALRVLCVTRFQARSGDAAETEELLQGERDQLGLLDEGGVAAATDDQQLGAGDLRRQLA